MRAAVISDTDGSTEFQKVKLEPQNWCVSYLSWPSPSYAPSNIRAWLAKKKASAGPKAETVQTLTYKISRLQQVNLLLEGMIRVRHVFWVTQWPLFISFGRNQNMSNPSLKRHPLYPSQTANKKLKISFRLKRSSKKLLQLSKCSLLIVISRI